jgi:hypothetical protein
MGMMNPPEPDWAGDEQDVSQQLLMLVTPRGGVDEPSEVRPATRDPQLTYTPPATIESHEPKMDREPVSAKSFKKSESPLQALMATVGSMAILAAIYHFGVWEGGQTQTTAPTQYASVATPPAMSVAPDPMQYGPALSGGTASGVLPFAESTPEPVLMTPPPVETAPQPVTPVVAASVAPAPKPTPVPVVAPTSGPKGLYLQVGALKDTAAARGLESKLRAAGFAVDVIEGSADGLIRVITGPYEEMPDARDDAGEMTALGIRSFPKRF